MGANRSTSCVARLRIAQSNTTMEEPLGTEEKISPFRLSQAEERLSEILRDQGRRKALLELRGDRAQSCIDGLNYFLSDPEIRRSAEPWVLKHTMIILRKLCEVSMLYPTCYVLGDIRNISSKSGGGFCDISQGRFKDQFLCLKIVRLFQDSNIKQLLRAHAREAILWSQLKHPNIVPFYGIFYLERKERICLVSPWMENGDIVEYLRRVPEAPRKPFVDDIVKGLQYLHAENIVHGDLKGRNVLIDDHQRACLADFGLSNIVTNGTLGFSGTTVAALGHTMRWASPELLLSKHACLPTRGSDMWAFGCLCYEVLTGLEPFMGCSDYAVIGKLIKRELPAQLDNVRLHLNEHLDKKLRNVIGRCWSIAVEQRPRCSEILQQLEVDSRARQLGDHPSKTPNQFWLSAPGATSNLRQLENLLEQLYRGNEEDIIQDTENRLRMPEDEDQTRGMQKERDSGMQEENKMLEEQPPHREEEERQQIDEEPERMQELHEGEKEEEAEEERIRIAKLEAERDERFKLEQMRMQRMQHEREERLRIAKEEEQKRKSAWQKMKTKERKRILREKEREERFIQEQKRLRQQREHRRADSPASPETCNPNSTLKDVPSFIGVSNAGGNSIPLSLGSDSRDNIIWRPSGSGTPSTAGDSSSGIFVDYGKAASASTSSKTQHQASMNFRVYFPNSASGTANSKSIDEQSETIPENHLPEKRQKILYQADLANASQSTDNMMETYLHHLFQWGALPHYDRLYWESFPWPMFTLPENPEQITAGAIWAYLNYDIYVGDVESESIKDRIKDQIKKWHPDRVESQWLPKVVEDKEVVKEQGVGKVVACLNDLILVFCAGE